MISERMDHPPFDDKAKGTTIDESRMRKLPIDTLPTELLEWVICLGATKSHRYGPELQWICEWRLVCRKWTSVIDHCSVLWSYIMVSGGTGHVRTQLAKSKGAPLNIRLSSFPNPQGEEWIRLLVDNFRRWKSITFNSHLEGVSAVLDSPPPMLEALTISKIDIPPDSKLFNPSSPNLRVLKLTELNIPCNIQPILSLEELHLTGIYEALGDRTVAPISIRKVHQLLQASPGLQVLKLGGKCSESATDKSLQQVNLPNLEDLELHGLPVLHLIRAEHCADLTVSLYSAEKKLSLGAWETVVPTLRRAKGLEVDVSKHSLRIVSLLEPPTIRLGLYFDLGQVNAGISYSILEEILQELEYESCISARIQLLLYYAHKDIGVKVLKLLQSPMPGSSSRWRLPHLDTVCIRGEGFPYRYLQAFVLARANAQGDHAPKAVTSIIESDAYGSRGKEILGKVMDYAGDERVAEGAVVQAG